MSSTVSLTESIASTDLKLRFSQHYSQAGLEQATAALTLGFLVTIAVYVIYGLNGFERVPWFEDVQQMRLIRIAVFGVALLLTLAFWDVLKRHWTVLGWFVLIAAFSLGPIVLGTRMLDGASTDVPILGWRAMTSQCLVILVTFPFLRMPLWQILIVAIPSTAVVIYGSFATFDDRLTGATMLISAIAFGSTIWFHVYKRERQLFEQSIALERAALSARKNENLAIEFARKEKSFQRAIVHDICQPMAAVGMQLSLLSQAGNDANSVRKASQSLAIAFDALQVQVNQLVGDSEGSSGTSEFRLDAVDLTAFVISIVDMHRPLAEQQGTELRFFIGKNASSTVVDSNTGVLATVFESLLANALNVLSYQSQEKRWIVVGVTKVNDSILVRVIDNGRGISEANIARVFDEGFTTGESPSNRGLGLYNAKRLVSGLSRHAVSVSSIEKRFASFRVRIPIRDMTRQGVVSYPFSSLQGVSALVLDIGQGSMQETVSALEYLGVRTILVNSIAEGKNFICETYEAIEIFVLTDPAALGSEYQKLLGFANDYYQLDSISVNCFEDYCTVRGRGVEERKVVLNDSFALCLKDELTHRLDLANREA